MRNTLWLALALVAVGCGDNGGGGDGGTDMAVKVGDASLPDLNTGPNCNPVDPGGDGQDCNVSACPMGTVGVILGAGACKCFYKCDPQTPVQCSCNRACISIQSTDGGVPLGGACEPGLGAGQRCGNGGTMGCAQGFTCAGTNGGPAYCLYNCGASSDCPAQTNCLPITNQAGMTVGMACTYFYGGSGNANGSMCKPTDACMAGFICDTTCKQQCDGPSGSCTTGTCTKVTDTAHPDRVIGWVCK